MAIAINKGKVPKDYTKCILDKNLNQSYNSSTGVINSDLTEFTNKSALSSFPSYYMIAELIVDRHESVSDVYTASGANSNINWNIWIDSEMLNKYRFIRFLLNPKVIINNNSVLTIRFLQFTLSLTVDGSTYTYSHVVTEDLKPGFNITMLDHAFLFDTRTKTLTDGSNDTESPTAKWSEN